MADGAIQHFGTLTDCELREALRERIHFLPTMSDRGFALSLSAASETSDKQRVWLVKMCVKAEKFRNSGPKGQQSTEEDIFNSDEPPRIPARTTQEGFKQHIAAPQVLASLDDEKLANLMKLVMGPAVEQLGAQVLAQADQRQAQFERAAARIISQEVLKRALEELERRKPREIVVTLKAHDATRSTTSKHVHAQFEHLVRFASIRRGDNGYVDGIFIAGEHSSGKTTGMRMLAELLGLPWHFNGAISFPHEMLGFIDGAGRYHRTPFREAYEHGGVYTFDEVDRSDPGALLAVNPHLANGLATFPDGQIKRHKDCIITGTANTWGFAGDVMYSGATKLDAAFLSRFPRKLQWDIDPQLEEDIVGSGEWLSTIREARRRAKENAGMKILVDMRHALAGKDLIAAGYTHAQAAEFTFLAGLKPDQRKVVEGTI
jgi:hypothetical protein